MMDDRQFEVTGTDHPSGAVVGRCVSCGTERTSSPGDVLAWKQHHRCPETVAKGVYAPAEPVERPGRQESTVDELAPQREQFGDFERRILTFEDEWARTHSRTGHANTGPKMSAIAEVFPDVSSTRYYQVLNRLLDMDEAEEFKPALVRRLRRRRDEARDTRKRATERAREIDAQTRPAPAATQEDRPMGMTTGERCDVLAATCRKAGLRAGPGGPNRAVPTHVVVGTGPTGDGYYRLVPAIGEAVRVYFVPVEGQTRDLGQALTHARAAGLVLDHLAGVHS